MDGVGLAGIGHTVGEDQAVLAVNEILDRAQHGLIKELLLAGVLAKDAAECEAVGQSAQTTLAGLEGEAVLGGTHEQ